MNEIIWKDIEELNGIYQISNTGEIRSVDHYTGKVWHKGITLKQMINHKGYHNVLIKKDGKKKTFVIHRCVARSFVLNPHPNLYDQVNHIDGVKSNNNALNLEWCNNSLNQIHANRMGLNANRIKKCIEGSSKAVAQYSVDGDLMGVYESARKANLETGVPYKSISLCCLGKNHTAYGFVWKFVKKKSGYISK